MLPQSKVEIDPAMQRDAGYYECQVDLTTINTVCHNHHNHPIILSRHTTNTLWRPR